MAVVAMEVADVVRELASAHHDRLVRAMTLVCGDLAEAEDAVQEAYMALWQTLTRGEEVAAPRAWLTAASRNRLRSGWRHRLVRARYLEGLTRVP